MKRLAAILCSLAFIACGSEGPTSLEEDPPGPAQSVEIVEGDGQTVQVQETTDTIRVVVRDDTGDPAPGNLISYEVDGPSDCGNWEASTLSSDQNGEGRNVIHIGTIADTRTDVDCTFRVVHSSQGAPEPLVDSAKVEVLPGAIAENQLPGEGESGEVFPQTYHVRDALVQDAHGNPAAWRIRVDSGGLRVLGTNPLDTLSRTLEADSTLERSSTQGDTLDTGTVTALHADTTIAMAEYAITQGDQERFLLWDATFSTP